MRNTKIALAVLALVASTAAMAESTIYGTVDAGLANTSSSDNTTSGTQFTGAGGWVAGMLSGTIPEAHTITLTARPTRSRQT